MVCDIQQNFWIPYMHLHHFLVDLCHWSWYMLILFQNVQAKKTHVNKTCYIIGSICNNFLLSDVKTGTNKWKWFMLFWTSRARHEYFFTPKLPKISVPYLHFPLITIKTNRHEDRRSVNLLSFIYVTNTLPVVMYVAMSVTSRPPNMLNCLTLNDELRDQVFHTFVLSTTSVQYS